MRNMKHKCPKCGKQMHEEMKFSGLWTCPDSKILLNENPPFKFKCDGMELTKHGAKAFEQEIHRVICERN